MRFYRVRLTDMYRGIYSVREISVWVKELPRGAQTWVYAGGAGSISDETDELIRIQYMMDMQAWARGGRKGQRPKVREYPKGIAAQQEHQQTAVSKAEAFIARSADRRNKELQRKERLQR